MTPQAPYPGNGVTFISAAPPGGGWYQVCEHTIKALRKEGLVTVDMNMEQRRGAVQLFEEMATERAGDDNVLVACSPGLTIQLLHAKSPLTYGDVTAIAATSTDYGVLVVSNGSTMAGLGDLVEALEGDPQSVRTGGGQPPGFMHDAIVKTVVSAAGLDASKLSYSGSKNPSDAIEALLNGDVAVSSMGAANVASHLQKGQVRLLAVLSQERLGGSFKDVPTAVEQGVDVTFPMWRGFYAPRGVSTYAREFWAKTLRGLSKSKIWSDTLGRLGWFPFFLAEEQFAEFLDEDYERYRAVVGE